MTSSTRSGSLLGEVHQRISFCPLRATRLHRPTAILPIVSAPEENGPSFCCVRTTKATVTVRGRDGRCLRRRLLNPSTSIVEPLRRWPRRFSPRSRTSARRRVSLPGADGRPDSEDDLTLRQLYDKHSLKHLEQLRHVDSGSFLATLVRSLSRMPSFSSLCIRDTPRNGSPWGTNPKLSLSSPSGHPAWLALGLPWHRVEDWIDPGARTLPPARLLTDLPTALHKAGVTLRQVKIDCLPYLPSNIALLGPGVPGPVSLGASVAWRGDL